MNEVTVFELFGLPSIQDNSRRLIEDVHMSIKENDGLKFLSTLKSVTALLNNRAADKNENTPLKGVDGIRSFKQDQAPGVIRARDNVNLRGPLPQVRQHPEFVHGMKPGQMHNHHAGPVRAHHVTPVVDESSTKHVTPVVDGNTVQHVTPVVNGENLNQFSPHNIFDRIKHVKPVTDSSSVQHVTPVVDGSSIQHVTPVVDGSSIQHVTPIVDESSIQHITLDSNFKHVTPITDGSSAQHVTPIVSGEQVSPKEINAAHHVQRPIFGSRKLFWDHFHEDSDSESDGESDSDSDSEEEDPMHDGRHQHHHHGHRHHTSSNVIGDDNTYSGALGFGANTDMCLYQNFDKLSTPCQNAIVDVYEIRNDYWHQSAPNNGCGAFMWLAFALIGVLLFKAFKRYRRRDRVEKVQTVLKTLHDHPELKSTVEGLSGVSVPEPMPKCGGCKCLKGLLLVIVSLLSAFLIAMSSLMISIAIIDGLTTVDSTTGEIQPPSVFVAILVLLAVSTVEATAFVMIVKGCRKARPSNQSIEVSAPVLVEPVNNNTNNNNNSFFGHFVRLVPSFSNQSESNGAYVALMSEDSQHGTSEMVSTKPRATYPQMPQIGIVTVPVTTDGSVRAHPTSQVNII
eukprot:CAMPEP_0196762440 /NCGR_PEP_ID=MMETSP1095-20130614/1947_1 /TAXON_ID=96789 ORGANISM="Chromulina nebulosa, Strain UTEXLB2642" /NCGR_SAMPLE_ID=MMETSP1095 /ASSEMBLY_ACC=CAM_ASM_000446 /LENGTH=622 /DNA_ID=CAMNT_0042113337 /DNA_START=316 /DNA_END=2184 /DNA_ORIENTATION=-